MNERQKKLIDLLKEMFQFDQADLDFGIYRIMNMKRGEISNYLNNVLPKQINEGIAVLHDAETENKANEIKTQIETTKSGSLPQAIKDQAIAEYEKQLKSLKSTNTAEIEGDVYNRLADFFSRYYDEGDFISQRRYKDGAYAIPYEGEEVKLYWANADQYYVKTAEYFADYTFSTKWGNPVTFKVIDAETERDNNKANAKRFFVLHDDKHFEIVNDRLFIYVEFIAANYKKQEDANKVIFDTLKKEITDSKYSSLFVAPNSKEKSEFERQLYRYTAKNTYDYFIHKDLGKFLKRELDFYIKNEVIHLDDIQVSDMTKTKEYLVKAQVIRDVAGKIIDFLAQIEDFQKKLYLKKKIVISTDYLITLDRIPERFYEEIASNNPQREEWVRLFSIDDIQAFDGTLTDEPKVGYSVPLSLQFLRENKYLVLDTKFFSFTFKESLLDAIDDLDQQIDGLLVSADNQQAINLCKAKYGGQIDCVYIDPPYNANSSKILYKNTFEHSSWMSFMFQRMLDAKYLLNRQFVQTIAIDEVEQERLGQLIDIVFPESKKVCVSVVHNPRGQQGKNISYTHEFAYFIYPSDKEKCLADVKRKEIDSRNLRDSGTESDRTDAATCFYPFYIKNDKIIGIGKVPEDTYHPGSSNVFKDGVLEIWPIDDEGHEKKWRYGNETVGAILPKLEVKRGRNSIQIIFNQDMGVMRSLWDDSKYDASEYGTKLIQNMFGSDYIASKCPNMYPKSIYNEIDCISIGLNGKKNGVVLDYFGGSGTTAHAVIEINRKESASNKYILFEMGEHFETLLKPRVAKAIYSTKWKEGKPVSSDGLSQIVKYQVLETFDDAISNVKFANTIDYLPEELKEEFVLKYMLETDARDSLFDKKKFIKPFSYSMIMTRKNESSWVNVDLIETFNYLIGLVVEHSYAKDTYDAVFEVIDTGALKATIKKGSEYAIKLIEGHTLSEDKVLVIWRDLSDDIVKDNAVLDEVLRKKVITVDEFDRIYINGDNNLPNTSGNKVFLIEEAMQKLMFEE